MYTERIHKAVMYAEKAHAGQTRKGNDIPYIYHPMEVLQILTEMGCDEDVKIAGVLHGTMASCLRFSKSIVVNYLLNW